MPPTSLRASLSELRGRPLPAPAPPERPADLPPPLIRTIARPISERAEADLCDSLAEWLRSAGWEVWFEVPLGTGRPDVIGLRNDTSLGIEAKLVDVHSVIKQGLRLCQLVDRAYIALPPATAGEAGIIMARLERDRPGIKLPGILAVGEQVHELRVPTSAPRRRVPAAELRAIAEKYGAERGGVPSTAQLERNIEIWRQFVAGTPVSKLADEFRLSDTAVRSVISRIRQWRRHVAGCAGLPCSAQSRSDKAYFAAAHRSQVEIETLPEQAA